VPTVGIGVDVVDIARFEASLVRTPALRHKLFTPAEAVLPIASLAARFAAKEALAKALGAPGTLAWHDAEVVSLESGQPVLELGVAASHLSLSHDGGVAIAFVTLT
jgi:holo-[acyl-carrier protein] synthase